MHIKTVIKYSLFSLITLLLIFLSLELIQRVRYSVIQKDWKWLVYFDAKGYDNGDVNALTNKRFIVADSHDPADLAKKIESSLPDQQRDEKGYRYIVCMGGSSTAGVHNDPEHKYPYLLDKLMNDPAPGRRFAVINFGMAGESSDSYNGDIDTILRKISPEMVIFYVGYNDIFIKDVNSIYATFTARLSPVYLFLERYSLLLLTLKEKYIIHGINQGKSHDKDIKRRMELEAVFGRNMGVCAKRLRDSSIRVVLIPEVLMAKNFGGPTANYEDYAEKYRNIPFILRAVADKYGCEFIDLQGCFDEKDFKRYFIDPVHLTDEGNARLSRLIFERSQAIKEAIGSR
jgi:lysophospholipase L1-like esterase